MEDGLKGSGGFVKYPVPQVTDEDRRRAVRVICNYATDLDDARVLFAAFGLDAEELRRLQVA